MKILRFLRERIKQPSVIGFLCATFLYLSVLIPFIDFVKSKSIKVKENGDKMIAMKIASVNNGGEQTNFSKAPPPPKKKPKPKKKPEPKKPKPKPKPQPEPEPTPEPEPKEETKEQTTQTKQETDEKQKSSNLDQEGQTAEALAYNEGISDEFLSKIRTAIAKNNPYPRIARVRGLEGQVTVEFILNVDGSIDGLKILDSNAGNVLNKSALQAVNDAAKEFPLPKQRVRIKVPIVYNLSTQ
ncbi:tonB transport protein [Helicobacter mustelae]|uniref:energy transducer TonB n=1 Tax=Helicobacter mustelae TaxID=217 RepID=UPI000E05BA6E|nr:energy transducer TonB [Helicobacter mustelae]STP12194.1 tonB transport protein [Helicobacter mustelae]